MVGEGRGGLVETEADCGAVGGPDQYHLWLAEAWGVSTPEGWRGKGYEDICF